MAIRGFELAPDDDSDRNNRHGFGRLMEGETVEMVASHRPRPKEMDAYERVLGEAMAGDAILFAREDYVEEAWRIVDPILKGSAPGSIHMRGVAGAPVKSTRPFCLPETGITRPRADQEDFRVAAQVA